MIGNIKHNVVERQYKLRVQDKLKTQKPRTILVNAESLDCAKNKIPEGFVFLEVVKNDYTE